MQRLITPLLLLAAVPAQPAAKTTSDFHTLRVLDLDGDGRLDRLGARQDGTLVVARNLGQRQFAEIDQSLPAVRPEDVLATDLNGDGIVDLYLVTEGENVALVGDGQGHFHDATGELGLADAGVGREIEHVDVDEDGQLDLVLHNADRDVIFWGADGSYERDASSPQSLPQAGVSTLDSADARRSQVVAVGTSSNSRSGGRRSRGAGSSLESSAAPAYNTAPTVTQTGSASAMMINDWCTPSLRDEATGTCGLTGSSIPMLGSLYPISSDWYVDAITGFVGLGNTAPTSRLDVEGAIRTTSGIEFADGSFQERAAEDLLVSAEVLDQSQLAIALGVAGVEFWQSFTVGLDGTLARIEPLYAFTGTTGTFRLFEGEGTDGTLLLTLPLQQATESASYEVSIPVTTGQQYTYEIASAEFLGTSSGGSYDGGISSVGNDLTFRTFVLPPGAEPFPAIELDDDEALHARTGMTIDGTVRSTSGGFEFPDGTRLEQPPVDLYVPAEVLDQEQPTPFLVSAGGNFWQSFTAGITGTLARVEVDVNGGAATCMIREGEGNGGAILATAEFDGAGWTPVEFDGGVPLTSGSVYTIHVTGSFGTSWSLLDGDPYAGGRSSGNVDFDHTFRTYVVPPGAVATPAVYLDGGHVGIGNDAPTHPLVVGTDTTNGNGAHVTTGGTWTNGSSRTWKSNFRGVDSAEILERLARLEILRWEYTGSDEGDHIGPMAEDFYAAFGLGDTNRYISTVDADGIALAAIQALVKENEELRTRIERLEVERD